MSACAVRRLRAAIKEMMPDDHFGSQSDNAPCNETCRQANGKPVFGGDYGDCLRHRPDIQGRAHAVADKCDKAPDVSCGDVCIRCIGLEALKPRARAKGARRG